MLAVQVLIIGFLWNAVIRLIFPQLPMIDGWAALDLSLVLSVIGGYFKVR